MLENRKYAERVQRGQTADQLRAGTLSSMLLELEVAAARAVGALSRLAGARRRHDAARASCSRRSTRGRSTGWPPGCRAASVLVSATNGKTTTTAMVGGDPRARALAYNHSGANLALGRRLHPARVAAAPSSACSRSTRRRCRRSPGASVRGSSRSGTSSATSSTATASSSSSPSAGARRSRGCPRRCSSSTPTIRCSASSHAARDRRRTYGLDDPRARPAVAPARGRLDVLPALRRAVRVRRGLRRPPRRLPLPALRPRAAPARRRGARDRAARPRRQRRSRSSTPGGLGARPARAAGALQRLQRDRRGRDRRRARRAARRDRGRASSASSPRSAASSGSPSATGGC